MEKNAVNVVIMGLKLIDAGTSLKAEDVHIVVFASQRERLLA
jgi:hypothetical protein